MKDAACAPLFSVLMVTHAGDQPDHLRGALQSLDEQTLRPAETILVCAGPLSDAHNSAISDYSDALLIKRMDLHRNRPLGFSLNIGLREASHEWIARMDADDICRPDRFEKQFRFIRENQGISVLGSAVEEFETDPASPVHKRNVPLTHSEIARSAFLRTPFNHMSVVYKKSAVQKVGGYRMIRGYEDFDLWTRMLVDGAQMANLPESLVLARIGNGFHQRRGGWTYAKSECFALRTANRINKTNPWTVRLSMPPRLFMRLAPAGVRERIYALVRR